MRDQEQLDEHFFEITYSDVDTGDIRKSTFRAENYKDNFSINIALGTMYNNPEIPDPVLYAALSGAISASARIQNIPFSIVGDVSIVISTLMRDKRPYVRYNLLREDPNGQRGLERWARYSENGLPFVVYPEGFGLLELKPEDLVAANIDIQFH